MSRFLGPSSSRHPWPEPGVDPLPAPPLQTTRPGHYTASYYTPRSTSLHHRRKADKNNSNNNNKKPLRVLPHLMLLKQAQINTPSLLCTNSLQIFISTATPYKSLLIPYRFQVLTLPATTLDFGSEYKSNVTSSPILIS